MSSTAGLTATGFVTPTLQALLTSINTQMQSSISPTLDVSPDQPIGQVNGLFAQMLADLWGALAALYAAVDPNQAEGVQLDNLSALTGTIRPGAKATTVLCNMTFTGSCTVSPGANAAVSGHPDQLFTLVSTVSVTAAATVTGTQWEAVDTGPIVVNPGTLTVIVSPVAGWASITNPLQGTTGQNADTDSQLRLLRQQELASAGQNIAAALTGQLLEVNGVISAYVYQNNTDYAVTEYSGLVRPPHSFEPVIYDGAGMAASNSDIAKTIWDNTPTGITSCGSTSASVVDAAGVTQTVYFTRATAKRLYVDVDLLTDPTQQYAGDAAVQTSVAAFIANTQTSPGKEVVASALEAYSFVTGVHDVTSLRLDFVPSPSNTANLTLQYDQVATLATSDVSVHSSVAA